MKRYILPYISLVVVVVASSTTTTRTTTTGLRCAYSLVNVCFANARTLVVKFELFELYSLLELYKLC